MVLIWRCRASARAPLPPAPAPHPARTCRGVRCLLHAALLLVVGGQGMCVHELAARMSSTLLPQRCAHGAYVNVPRGSLI